MRQPATKTELTDRGRCVLLTGIVLASILLCYKIPVRAQESPTWPSASWGRIANNLHHGEKIYCALFFAGPPNPGSLELYTHHPVAADRQRWSDDDHINAALKPLADCGLNTIKLSYWGHDGETDASAPAWLFSRTRWPGDKGAGQYSDEDQIAQGRRFFELAAGQGLLVAPMLEVSPKFPFYAEFPGDIDNLVARAAWLLKGFGDEPNWLKVYDSNGQPRRVIWLIETIHGSPIDADEFAASFGAAATEIKQSTGYDAGFIIDPTPLPPYGSTAGPDPAALIKHASILAVNPFNITSQGTTYTSDLKSITDESRQQYAESVLSQWRSSGIPLIAPIMPGYDAHIVFPQLPSYGFNDPWRQRQKQLAVKYETDGISIDIWNGWTEGYAIPPSIEDGNADTVWAEDVIRTVKTTR
jgi:hypothetical protein